MVVPPRVNSRSRAGRFLAGNEIRLPVRPVAHSPGESPAVGTRPGCGGAVRVRLHPGALAQSVLAIALLTKCGPGFAGQGSAAHRPAPVTRQGRSAERLRRSRAPAGFARSDFPVQAKHPRTSVTSRG